MSYNQIFNHIWDALNAEPSLSEYILLDSLVGGHADKNLRKGVIEFDAGTPYKKSVDFSLPGCDETRYLFQFRVSVRMKTLAQARAAARDIIDKIQDTLDSEDGNYGNGWVQRTSVRFEPPMSSSYASGEARHGFDTAVISFKTSCKVYESPGNRAQ